MSNFFLTLPLLRKYQKHPVKDVPPGMWPVMVARCVIGTVLNIFNVLASMWLPVFFAQVIINMMPFFTASLGFLINKESIKKSMIACMFGCFAGVVILNYYRPKDKEDKNSGKWGKYFNYGMMSAFAFCILGSIVTILNRRMKAVHFCIINLNYAATAWLSMLVVIIVEYAFLHDNKERYPYPRMRILTYGMQQWCLILAYCAANFFVQVSINYASQREKSAFIALMVQFGVVWSFLADFFVLNNPVQGKQVIGVCVIIFFNFTAVLL